ncbi:hypothetical protein [Herbaspirillum sp. YR522]|uniref:hypothetical protein n=1 Tax=Herbaspirillum sp. YR522 TaxID=1144342 RepID=UPI0012F7BD0D|nr:hypothetical protein [Herbaspirillum sp. YR522]
MRPLVVVKARDPDGQLVGVEVKTSILGFFNLNAKQVAFDIAVYDDGASSRWGIITSFGYVGVGMGNIPTSFQSAALQSALRLKGVTLDVIPGLKVK